MEREGKKMLKCLIFLFLSLFGGMSLRAQNKVSAKEVQATIHQDQNSHVIELCFADPEYRFPKDDSEKFRKVVKEGPRFINFSVHIFRDCLIVTPTRNLYSTREKIEIAKETAVKLLFTDQPVTIVIVPEKSLKKSSEKLPEKSPET